MKRLAVGDRVIALNNPCVPKGTPGIIEECYPDDIYEVRFDDPYFCLAMHESQIKVDSTEESPQKPTRELKVGDKVRIKSRKWYDANKDANGRVNVPCTFTPRMVRYCGNTYEIAEVLTLFGDRWYHLKGLDFLNFSEEMFDLDEPTGESSFDKSRRACMALFGVNSKPIIKVNLPLIKVNKLLTDIKSD